MNTALQLKLTLRIREEETFFGPGVTELLHRIDEGHSIRAAAEEMYLSYSKALKMIRGMEAALGCPVLQTKKGGNDRGSSVLTGDARRFLTAWDELTEELHAQAAPLFQQFLARLGE